MTNKSIPLRKCIGCAESKPKEELRRIALYEGELTLDKTGNAKGRGVYICKSERCIEAAEKRNAIQRGFKRQFDRNRIEAIFEELKSEQK